MLKTEHSLYSIAVSTFGLFYFGATNTQGATAVDEGDEEEQGEESDTGSRSRLLKAESGFLQDITDRYQSIMGRLYLFVKSRIFKWKVGMSWEEVTI